MVAAEEGHIEIVRLLLPAGAQRDDRDPSGRTALDYAEREGRREVARLLHDPDAGNGSGRR